VTVSMSPPIMVKRGNSRRAAGGAAVSMNGKV
jgi:hypothetical protein